MKYTIKLKDTRTNETRSVEVDDTETGGLHGLLFQWFENNFSCDCNRSLFFYDWDDWDDSKELPCGDDTIVIEEIRDSDGNEVDCSEYRN